MPISIPKHIAIIMDGNGRWALAHGKSRLEGHALGASIIEGIVDSCKERGVKYLTLYAFSSENWERPPDEVKALMHLLDEYILAKKSSMIKKGVRFKVIGDVKALPQKLQDNLNDTIEATKSCNEITMSVALSYGSRQEITNAFNEIAKTKKNVITEKDIEEHLYTKGIPAPDLLIRTGGEYRISNFLLWQAAYAELYFTPIYWPEFNEAELDKAIEEFSNRERRFGKISKQVTGEE